MKQIIKKLISLLIILIYTMQTVSAAFAEPPDISKSTDSKLINEWISEGLASPQYDGNFKPNEVLKRVDFFTYINKIFNYSEKSNQTFPDVIKNTPAANEITKAVAAGYITPDKNGKIAPFSPITRLEAVVILSKVFELEATNVNKVDEFNDADKIPAALKAYVSAMKEKGFIEERPDGNFLPGTSLTRIQAIKLIDSVMGEAINKPGNYYTNTEKNLVISTGNVTLRNMVVKGDLYITEGVGDGNVTLDGIRVMGRVIIHGGGEHSVVIKNSIITDAVTINKEDGRIRLAVEGTSSVPSVKLQSGATIEGNVSGSGSVGEVKLLDDIGKGQAVVLAGKVNSLVSEAGDIKVTSKATISNVEIKESASNSSLDILDGTVSKMSVKSAMCTVGVRKGIVASLDVQGSSNASKVTVETGAVVNSLNANGNVSISLTGGIVSSLSINSGASGSNLYVADSSTINNFSANGSVTVKGQGKISTANVNIASVTFEKKPDMVLLASGVTSNINGVETNSSTPTVPGKLLIDPASAASGISRTINLTYTPGEAYSNGTVIFYLPNGISANIADVVRIGTGNTVALTSDQVGNGQKITISGVASAPVSTIAVVNGQNTTVTTYQPVVLTLLGKVMPAVNTYTFHATGDVDGSGTRPATPGLGDEMKTFGSLETNAPTMTGVTLDSAKKVLTISFNENILNNLSDINALKAAVKIAADGTNFKALNDKDTVSILNNSIVINFAAPLSTETNVVQINANSIKDTVGNVKTDITATDIMDAVPPVLNPGTGVALSGNHKIVTLAFSENIINNLSDAAALKAAVKIAADGVNYTNLGTNDTVSISNNKMVITFASPLTTALNVIKINANSLKDQAGNIKTDDTETNAIAANADIIPPTVNAALNYVDSTHLKIVFSEEVDKASAEDASNYTLSGTSGFTGNPSECLLQSNNTEVLLTVTDMSGLVVGKTVIVTVSGVKDSSGNTISGTNAATYAIPDKTPPTVNSALAYVDATHVKVTFSEQVDSTANTATNYQLSGTGGLSGNPTTAVKDTNNTEVLLTVGNMSSLATGQTVIVTVTGVKDLAGNQISSNNIATYSKLDTTPPTVNVSLDYINSTQVKITYNEDMDQTTAETVANYTLSGSGGSTGKPSLAELQANNKEVILTVPDMAAWVQGKSLIVTVTGAKDTSGNTITGTNTATYTVPDTTPPAIDKLVYVDATHIKITYTEPVDSTAGAAASYTISGTGGISGKPSEAQKLTNNVDVILTIPNISGLTPGQTVIITVTGVKDMAGNTITTGNSATYTILDTKPPILSTVLVYVNSTQVKVTFDEDVDETSAETKTNYFLSGTGGLSGNPSLAERQSGNKEVILTISDISGLAQGKTVKVSVMGVKDIAGNTMSGTSYATYTVPDTTAPVLNPDLSYINSTQIKVSFDEAVDPTTAQSVANYQLSGTGGLSGNPVSAARQSNGKEVLLTVSNMSGIALGESIIVTVSGVKDMVGNTMAANSKATYIKNDTTAPVVNTLSYIDTSHVKVTFNEEIETLSAETAANYTLSGTGNLTGHPDSADLQSNNKEVILTVTGMSGLAAGKTVIVTVSGVKDIAGNAVGSSNTASFTITDATPPDLNPAITYISGTQVKLIFNEDVEKLSAETKSNYLLSGSGGLSGNPVSAVRQINNKEVILTISDISSWTQGKTLIVTVTGVTDLTGNSISDKNSATYTVADTTLPKVLPDLTYMNATQVKLTFDKAVGVSANTKTNYTLSGTGGLTGNPSSVVLQSNNTEVLLTIPSISGWAQGKTLIVTVTGVKDTSGNTIGTSNVATYTVPDTTPPKVTSLSSDDGTHVRVVFSEAVDTSTSENTDNYVFSGSGGLSGNPSKAERQSNNNEVVLTISDISGWSQGKALTVTVTGVKDLAGNTISGTNSATYTVPDTTPPELDPDLKYVNSTQVKLIFDEAVGISANTKSNYTLSGTGGLTGNPSSAAVQSNNTEVLLTIPSISGWVQGKTLIVTVAGVKDISGNTIGTSNVATYTVPDTAPPKVTSLSYDDGTHVRVVFSEDVDSATSENKGNYAFSGSGGLSGNPDKAERQSNNNEVVLTISDISGWSQGKALTVTVTGVKDLAGNIISGTNSATYTVPDTTPPEVKSIAYVDATHLKLTFSEAVDTTANTAANYSLSGTSLFSGNPQQAVRQSNNTDVIITVGSMSALLPGQTIIVTVSGVKDMTGVAIASVNNSATYTILDTTPPVYSTATIDATHKIVTLKFNEAINYTTDLATLKSNIQLAANGTTFAALGSSDTITISGTDLKITFNTVLTGNANKIKVLANALKDAAGNILTTVVTTNAIDASGDVTPPTLVSAVVNGANPSQIVLTFNETLGNKTPDIGDFQLGTTGKTVSNVTLNTSAKTITLTVNTDITNTDGSFNIVYKPSTGNEIQDTAGNAISSQTTWAVTNTVSAPAKVTNVSSTNVNGTYSQGRNIYITVTFDGPVTVTGAPTLIINNGGTGQAAAYVSGSTTNTLTFAYAVQAGDSSSDLDYKGTGALALNGGSIYNNGTVIESDLTLPTPGNPGSLAANKAIVIDTAAPKLDTPVVSPVYDTTATLSVQSDKNGYAYYVILPKGSTIPNVTQIKTGTDAWDYPLEINLHGKFGLAANKTVSTIFTGLEPDTDYIVYMVAEDSAGNIQTDAANAGFSTISTADKNPPDAPTVNVTTTTNNSTNIQVTSNESGKAYYVVLPFNSVDPSAEQIKAGTDSLYTDLPANRKGSIPLIAYTPGSFTVSGLTASTSYYIYVAVEDIVVPSNLQTTYARNTIATAASASTTAPSSFTPVLITKTSTTANISIITDKDGKAYYVALPASTAIPSAAQVKAGTNAAGTAQTLKGTISVAANTNMTIGITGLTKSTAYDIYIVAEDTLFNLQTSAAKINITTDSVADIIPPDNAVTYPKVDSGDTFLNLRLKYNESGKAYYVVLYKDIQAPSAQQVKLGKDGAGAAPVKSGSVTISADTESIAAITGLLVSTLYDVYVVAEDSAATPNLQLSPTKLSVASTPLDLSKVGINVAAGQITGTAATMEYSLDATSGTTGTWKVCSATNTLNVLFNSGNVYVREKANTSNYRLVACVTQQLLPSTSVMSGISFNVAAGTITGTGSYNNLEYCLNGTTWNPVTAGGTTSNLTFQAGLVYMRFKATATQLASFSRPIGYSSTNPQGTPVIASPAAPALVYDDVADTITGLDSSYEYSISSGPWTSNLPGDFTGAKTVQVRLKATPTTLAGQVQNITFTKTLSFSGVSLSIPTAQINGTTSSMQYSIDSTDGTNGNWTGCSSTGITNITNFASAINVYIRDSVQRANFKKLAGAANPPAGVSVDPSDPANAKKLSNATTAMEYSRDGGSTWMAVSTGIASGTTTIDVSTAPNNDLRVRVKATSLLLASLPTASLNPAANIAGVGINVSINTITATTASMEYSLNSTDGSNGIWTVCSSPVTTGLTLTAGKVYVRAIDQPKNYVVFTIAAQGPAPTAVLSPTATVAGNTKITGLDAAKTYQYLVDTNSTITGVSSAWSSATVLTSVAASGNVAVDPTKYIHIREKGTAAVLPSAIQNIQVKLANIKPDAKPDVYLSNVPDPSGYYIYHNPPAGTQMVDSNDKLEFSLDGAAWADVGDNMAFNLPGGAGIHVLYVREKATTTMPASDLTNNLAP